MPSATSMWKASMSLLHVQLGHSAVYHYPKTDYYQVSLAWLTIIKFEVNKGAWHRKVGREHIKIEKWIHKGNE